MHQTQSFLENQTNILRILLGSFIRKTIEEKLFCLSQHVLSAWSINLSVIGYSTDSTRWLGFSLKVYLHISWLLSEIGQTTEFWSGMKLEASGASGWWLHSNLAATLVQVVSTWTQNTGVTWEAEGDTELNTGKSNDFWNLYRFQEGNPSFWYVLYFFLILLLNPHSYVVSNLQRYISRPSKEEGDVHAKCRNICFIRVIGTV